MGDDDRPADEPDPFEGLTLDDDFVRGAEVVEESADARLARLARIEAEHRRLAETREVQRAELDRSLRRRARKQRRASRFGGHWLRLAVVAVMMAVFASLLVWNLNHKGSSLALGGGGLLADGSSSSVSSTARPPAGVGSAPEPLGTPPEIARESSAHRFVATQDGTDEPVAYDPCRAIHVVVNERTAYPGGRAVVQESLDEVGRATGLVFVVDGLTDETPADDRAEYQPDRYPGQWAPVLISWTDPTETADLAGNVDGIGGSSYVTVDRGYVYVTGSIELDGPALAELALGIDGAPGVRAVIEHELGHLVGLDHVDDPSQLMYPTTGVATSYADGDLTGLARLGQGECFPSV